MKLLLAFIFLFQSLAYGQKCSFKEIKRKPKDEFYKTKDLTIIFPVVIARSPSVSKLINTKIKNEIVDSPGNKKPIEAVLSSLIEDGLTDMSYDVTLNKNNILSFYISAEGCGAYCSSWTKFFNFDLRTGRSITINDLIRKEKFNSFRDIAFKKKVTVLTTYKSSIKEQLLKNEIDSDSYNMTIEEVDNYCINTINMEDFSLSNFYLELIDACELPHVIQSLGPTYQLKYYYTHINEFLKPGLLTRLQK